MKRYLILLFVIAVSCGCQKKQKVIFKAESIEYRNKDSYFVSSIQNECSKISEDLSSYLNNGWKVVTSSPKSIMVYRDIGTCVGTEYVLEK